MKEGWEYFMKEFDPSDSATVELWLTSRFVRLGVGDGDTQSVDQTRGGYEGGHELAVIQILVCL